MLVVLGVAAIAHSGTAFRTALRSSVQPRGKVISATAPAVAAKTEDLKTQMLTIAALTDRGQRLNTLIAPTYQEKRDDMESLVEQLRSRGCTVTQEALAGEWELVYASVELFRSSPFFLALEEALNNSPGIPTLGRWLGATDPTQKAQLFFKLHMLQVLSWGVSTVGRIAQRIDFEDETLESEFDTVIFGLTVIPILGWFKLLPTFGGRVVTVADSLRLKGDTLEMTLQTTRVVTCPGVPRLPLLDGVFMDRSYPVNSVWRLLPWNGGPFEGRQPTCSMRVEYVDETMRVSRDGSGALFVYTRPSDVL